MGGIPPVVDNRLGTICAYAWEQQGIQDIFILWTDNPTGCVYDFPTSSEGKFPDIVDLKKKRQYTPLKIET